VEDVRASVLELMASRPGPWYVIDLHHEIGCKWGEIFVALTALENQGKIGGRRIATGNPDHPVRRGWELA